MLNRILNFLGLEKKQKQPTMANYALDAARYDDAWGHMPWPLRANDEWDAADLRVTYQRARALYNNCAPIHAAVENMVRYIGVLSPLPATLDEGWNALALAAWKARTKNPNLFDLAGRVNYRQAMQFMERSAIVDGDVAVVPTYASDGGAAFMFYTAPQISGGGTNGVDMDAHGRAIAYHINNAMGESYTLPAHQLTLYQHRPDPTRLRGHTMLAAALRNGKDLLTIVGYTKQGVKLASSMGLITTKAVNSPQGNYAAGIGGGAKVNPQAAAPMPTRELGTGLSITNLPEGWDIKTIADGRPSAQLQAFFKFLVGCVAQGVTLDTATLYDPGELSSAGTRFSLEKLRRYQDVMTADQEVVANTMWRHVIACEIAAGRLRACHDPAWINVRWIQERDMTIDTARVATAQINLTRELLADTEDYTLRTCGLTPAQLARKRAREIAYQKKVAEQNGLTLDELRQGMVGTVTPDKPDTPAQDPAPLPDDDPEQA